jgi:tetratricopeptide (TPR) repeat protein
MRTLLAALLIVAASVPTARADERTDKARQAYESGMAHFNLDEFDAAISEFQEAYRNKPDPLLLYNIAQAARLGKRTDMAIDYYEKYVRLAPPKSPNLLSVKAQIETLKKLRAAQEAAIGAKPRTAIDSAMREPSGTGDGKRKRPAPAVDNDEPEEPAHAPAAVQPKVEPEPEPVSKAPVDESTPIYKKPLFWIVGVVLVAVIGAGIGLGVGLSSGGTTIPMADYGPVNLLR